MKVLEFLLRGSIALAWLLIAILYLVLALILMPVALVIDLLLCLVIR